MYTLLFFFFQILNVTGWQLLLSTILIILSIVGGIWRFDRSRKKDLKQKADISYVDKKMEDHEKVHEADNELKREILSDLKIIKEHLINRKK